MIDKESHNLLTKMRLAFGTKHFQRTALILIVLVSFTKGIVWSLLIPPLYGFDEPLHFLYGRNIALTRNVRIKSSTLIPLDIWELDEPAEKRTRLKNGISPRDVYHDDVEFIVATQPYFYTYHPPLYYCLLAGIGSCLNQAGILWEVLGCRFVSICLGAYTAILAYLSGRIFWKEEKSLAPIAMATLVVYQPMSAFSFSTITNSSLEITLVSALLLIGLRIIHDGFTKKLSVMLSIIFLCGMLNKLSFFACAPLVVLLGIWSWSNQSKFGISFRELILRVFIVALPGAAASFWWCQLGRTGRDNIVHSFEMQTNPKTFSLLRYFSTKPWFESYGKAVASYFGHFGWKNASLALPLIVSLTVGVALCAVISCVRAVKDLRVQESFQVRCRGCSVLFLTAASLSFIFFYGAVDLVNSFLGRGWFTIRGQYYLSTIVGQALWVVSAIQWKNSTLRSNLALVTLCFGAMLLNFYALIGVVTAHCYGVCDLTELFIRVANLQPVSPATVGGLFFTYVLVSFLLLGFLIMLSTFDGRKPETGLRSNEVV